MLQKLHDRSGSLVIKIILTVIGASFVVFGVADVVRIITSTPPVAKVGRHSISFQEFYDSYQRALHHFNKVYNQKIPEKILKELPDMVVEDLIKGAVLGLEPKKLGIMTPKKSMMQTISSMPIFLKDGVFSPALFQQVLQHVGIQEGAFIADIEKQMIQQQFFGPLSMDTKLNDFYADLLMKTVQNRKSYDLVYAPDHFEVEAPEDAVLETYLKENAEKYLMKEQRSVKLYVLDHIQLKESLPVTEQELKEEYEVRQGEWVSEEQRMVYRIACSSQEDAERVKKLLLGKTKLSQIPKRLPGVEVKKNGMVEKRVLPQEVADSIFALDIGGSLGPILSDKKFLVYVVTKIIPSAKKSAQDPEVKKSLESSVRDRKLTLKLEETKNIIEDAFSGGDFSEVCAKLPMKEVGIEQLSQANRAEKLKKAGIADSASEAIGSAIFELDEGGESSFIDIEKASVIVRIAKVEKEHTPELSVIQKQVLKDWTQKQMEKEAFIWSDQNFRRLDGSSATWKETVKKQACKTEAISISQLDLLNSEASVQKMFSEDTLSTMLLMRENTIESFQTKDGKVVAVRMKGIESAPSNVLDGKKLSLQNEIKTKVVEGVQEDRELLLQNSIQATYSVKINKKTLEKVQKRFSDAD